MAVGALDRATALFGEPIYAFHQIVHNTVIVDSFERRGVRFVDDLAMVPRGATIVFSAHGVAPAVRTQVQGLVAGGMNPTVRRQAQSGPNWSQPKRVA